MFFAHILFHSIRQKWHFIYWVTYSLSQYRCINSIHYYNIEPIQFPVLYCVLNYISNIALVMPAGVLVFLIAYHWILFNGYIHWVLVATGIINNWHTSVRTSDLLTDTASPSHAECNSSCASLICGCLDRESNDNNNDISLICGCLDRESIMTIIMTYHSYVGVWTESLMTIHVNARALCQHWIIIKILAWICRDYVLQLTITIIIFILCTEYVFLYGGCGHLKHSLPTVIV